MTTLYIVGNVQTVLEGKVSPDTLKPFPLDFLRYALGAGSFTDPTLFGETCIIDHVAWGTLVNASGQLITENSSQFLKTPFLMGIPKDAPFTTMEIEKSLSIEELYRQTSSLIAYGAAVVGKGIFDSFEGVYLKKSPIFGENVNVYHEYYWEHPAPMKNQEVLFFGILITDEGKNLFVNQLGSGFYQNPNEPKPSMLMSHTHGALLHKEKITGIRHMLTSSVLQQGQISLFPIDAIQILSSNKL